MTADAEPTGHLEPPASKGNFPAQELKPPWRRFALLVLLVAVLLGLVYLSPLGDYLAHAKQLSQKIRDLGLLGPVVLMLGVAVLVAAGFPRLLFCVLAGMALGFWQGLLWTQLGTLLGNYVLFMAARAGGGGWVRGFVNKRASLAELLDKEGIAGVILARQLPVPGLVINLALGLVSIRHRDFIIGTVIGQLPAAIPCTLIGAGALKDSFGKSAGFVALAGALALAGWIGLRWFLRAQKK
jgi:uncharacterized membrane protein YdjX (TVP38/TMEM64 family)